MVTSRGVGAYVAGEAHKAIWSGEQKPGAGAAVLDAQGSHGLADSITSADDMARMLPLSRAGFVCIAGDMGQTASQGTFGNDTAVTRLGQLKDFVQGASSPMQARSGSVRIIAGSGGCTAALNYARANPANVAALFLICPLVDIEDFYNNWTGGGANGTAPVASGVTKAEMDTAYGGTAAFAAAMPSHNPIRSGNQAALAGIPIWLAYSTDDPYIPVQKVLDYAALVPSAQAVSQGAAGHTGLGVNSDDVVRHFSGA